MSQIIRQCEVTAVSEESLPTLEEFLTADPKPDSVWIDAHEEVEAIQAFVPSLKLIVLNFPTFADGRAYSSANMLRRQYGFQGELRASGDVRVDQLDQMTRCGFDAFHLADGQDAKKGLEKLKGFSFSYQTGFNREPLFRQRAG